MKHIFRSLNHPNFRLFFISQFISLIGTWMQQVAVSWLVYRLTGSAFWLGAVNFTMLIPTLLLSPLAGSVIDRLERRRLVILTQSLFFAQTLIFTVLVLSNTISCYSIVAFSICFGILSAFDIPARQAFLVELIDQKEDLPNAIALYSIMFNGARIIGPALAGILIAVGGEGTCFVINAVSYAAPIYALLKMSIPRPEKLPTYSLVRGMLDGIAYLRAHRPISNALLLLAIMSFAGMPLTVLMPIYAKEILRGGAGTLGFLMASTGAGAFCGAIYLAQKRHYKEMGRTIRSACILFGVAAVFFSHSRNLLQALFFLYLAGFGMMIQMNCSNILLQTNVSDAMRGRLMSFYTIAFLGVTPFGGLIAGALAARWGAPWTVAIGGAVCIFGAIVIYLPRRA